MNKQIPTREQWLHDNKEALNSLDRGIKDVAAGQMVYRGRWSNPQEWRKSDA